MHGRPPHSLELGRERTTRQAAVERGNAEQRVSKTCQTSCTFLQRSALWARLVTRPTPRETQEIRGFGGAAGQD